MSSISCCGPAGAADVACTAPAGDKAARVEELMHSGRLQADGSVRYVLNVPEIHCGLCITTIEDAFKDKTGVTGSRVNMSLRRVTVDLDSADRSPVVIIDTLAAIGYSALPVDLGDAAEVADQRQGAMLLRALAVSGFAAGNIMLLSVSVWSGADGATRDLFHMISALIALPAIGYAGQPFFRSAISALRHGRLNMDVPISLGVLLALFMSIFESLTGGEEAYFDAAVTLLFFLLIGRYLDNMMRDRARSSVLALGRLSAKGAMHLRDDGTLTYVPVDEIRPGMVIRVAAGERFPVDGAILSGESDIDRSLVTGESAPVPATKGMAVEGGALNLTGSLDIRATCAVGDSFLAEVLQMMEAAENGRGRYTRIADRLSRIYSPVVHALALLAFLGWMIVTGGDWHTSILVAISVLIITCPCALGLAVPVVHVIGASRLFAAGILMKDGSALERLAEADRVVFDKTGTLTTGVPALVSGDVQGVEASLARSLAAHSTHPASRAILAGVAAALVDVEKVREVPGCGVEGIWSGKRVRLGKPDWAGALAAKRDSGDGMSATVSLCVEGGSIIGFELAETLRDDAASTIASLEDASMEPEMLSGDNKASVTRLAARAGMARFRFAQTPASKIARIKELHAAGHKVFMVGDGLNDAPALAAGHVSMAPASASDVGRLAADFVFTRESIGAVAFARAVAKATGRLVRQNFGLAIIYNIIAVPLAFAGYVTPLIAAIAMSSSSIIVVANSMRLALGGPRLRDFVTVRNVSAAKSPLRENKAFGNAGVLENAL